MSYVFWVVGIVFGVVLIFKVWDELDHWAIRRRARQPRDSAVRSICRWGFNDEGELVHVRVARIAPE